MAIWTVTFVGAVTVEAGDEDAAIAAAVEKLDQSDPGSMNLVELDFFDFEAWSEGVS